MSAGQGAEPIRDRIAEWLVRMSDRLLRLALRVFLLARRSVKAPHRANLFKRKE